MTDPIFLDFESEAIAPRPEYPPKPVGLAVLDRTNQFESKYWSFGHSVENNCTYQDVKSLLVRIWESGRSICFHNSMFDTCIIHERFGLPYLPAARVHDTLILAFLHDPFSRSLSLKELCKDWLGIKPEERDELFEWLVANVPAAAKKPKSAGAYIARGPGELVGRYAMADVRLTSELFTFTEPVRQSMAQAYHREMSLLPVLLENSKLGVRVDTEGLQSTLFKAQTDIAMCDEWLNKYFNNTEINYNSGVQLVNAIFAKGVNDKTKDWPASDKGTPLSDKDTIKSYVTDPELSSVLRHRDLLVKLTGTYIEPWLEQSASTGRIYTEWNPVRGEVGGTRTGRLSAKPTLQTMPTRGPKTPLPESLQSLVIPMVRKFILPDEGHLMVAADFQAQELRLFAHFESGKLAEKYRQDPNADLHTFAANLMGERAGRTIPRDYAKTLSFGILYGAGPKKISEMLNIAYDEAKQLIDLYKSEVAQGLSPINDDLFNRYRMRLPFSTIGGRLIKGEPPKIINGRLMNFAFKSLNNLIQGSGADMTKQAMIDFAACAEDSRLLMSLHDELIITAREDVVEREGKKLEQCMINAFKLDVPMVAEYKIGNNFGEVK